MKLMKIMKLSKKKIIGILVLITALFISVNVIIRYVSGTYECYSQWSESNIEYKYTLRGGCLLNRNDGWLPAKNFRID